MPGKAASFKALFVQTGPGSGVRKAVLLTAITGVIALAAGACLLGWIPGPPVFSGLLEARPRPLLPAAAALLAGDAWICSSIGMRRGYLWCEIIALICAVLVGILGLNICLDRGSPAGYLLLSLAVAEGFALVAYRVALGEDRKARSGLSVKGSLPHAAGRMS